MAVFRIERTKDYTVMSNHHLRNHELSLKAKGLLSMMLSLPDDWNYTTPAFPWATRTGTAVRVTRYRTKKSFWRTTPEGST